MCLQFRKRGRSRISFVGQQPGLQDVGAAEDTDWYDADTYVVADVVASVDDANVEYTDAEESGIDGVLQDEFGEGDGGEGEQVDLLISSNSHSFANELLNTICFVHCNDWNHQSMSPIPGSANQVGKKATRQKNFATEAKLLHELLTPVNMVSQTMSYKFNNWIQFYALEHNWNLKCRDFCKYFLNL